MTATRSRAKKRLMDESNLLVLNFVKSIGIFDNNDTFSDSFREMVENCSRNFAVDNLNVGTRSLGMEEVVMLCLMGSVHELTGDGLRIGLANRASTLAAHFFKTFHPGEWHAAHEVLKRKVQIRAK